MGVPSPPGAPDASRVTGEEVDLTWEPPAAAGGSGIAGYQIEMRSGGEGEFSIYIRHTGDPEPRATVSDLLPMTWYEFRVAAVNAHTLGPPGPLSNPVLTRGAAAGTVLGAGGAAGSSSCGGAQFDVGGARSGGGVGVSGRRRRTKQLGLAHVAAERETHAAMLKREEGIALDIERSIASLSAWDDVFKAREGRSPRDEDREASRVLRDEAHTLRVLRHEHAEAALATLDAERTLVIKEQAVAKMGIRKWEKTHLSLTGREPSDTDRSGDPKHAVLLSRVDLARGKLQRLVRRRKRVLARLEAARHELGVAAADESADAAVIEAAADAARRATSAAGEGAGQERAKVVRRWTQGMKGDVAAREQQYQALVLERATSRQLLDAVSGMPPAVLRTEVLVFSNADKDGDGVLSTAEFRDYAEEQRRQPGGVTNIVFEALLKRADVDGNGGECRARCWSERLHTCGHLASPLHGALTPAS